MSELPIFFRHILRRGRPLLLAALLLAMAAGITCGVWTVFSLVLLKPLPFPASEQLVQLWDSSRDMRGRTLSSRQFMALRHENPATLKSIAIYRRVTGNVGSSESVVPVNATGFLVNIDFFNTFRTQPVTGRLFTSRDGDPAIAGTAVVLNEPLAHTLLSGKTARGQVQIDGLPYDVIGIVANTWTFPIEADYFLPILSADEISRAADGPGVGASTATYAAIGRLEDGATIEAAAGELSLLLNAEVRVESLHAAATAPIRPVLVTLQLVAVFILVLACVNAAWVLEWHSEANDRDLRIMRALGARPGHLITYLALEISLLAIMAAPAAICVAAGVLHYVALQATFPIPRAEEIAISPTLIISVAGVTFLCSIVAALPASARSGFRALPAAGMTSTGWIQHPLRRYTLLVLQAALAFAVALETAGASIGLHALLGAEQRGYDGSGLSVADVALPDAVDGQAQVARALGLSHALSSIGIPHAITNTLPLTDTNVRVSLRRNPDRSSYAMTGVRLVSGTFFDMLGIRVLAGRAFAPNAGRPEVVVNDVLARQLAESPNAAVGERIILGGVTDRELEIVGIVKSVRHANLLTPPQPEAYLLYEEGGHLRASTFPRIYVLIATEKHIGDAVQSVVAETLPGARVSRFETVDAIVWRAAGEQPLLVAGSSVFASGTVLLMLLGFYGFARYTVTRRLREFAIRRSLGATDRRIAALAGGIAAAMCVSGMIVGGALHLLLRRVAEFGTAVGSGSSVESSGFLTIGIGILVVACATAIACYGPIQTAISADPVVALREE